MPSSRAPSASTASRPASLTLRNAPLVGRDGKQYRIIRIFWKVESYPRDCDKLTRRAIGPRLHSCGIVSGSHTIARCRPLPGCGGAARAPRINGPVNRRECNAFCLGTMSFDRSLSSREFRRTRTSCQIARHHRSSRPGWDPKLHRAERCADLSRRLRSGWPAD